jgi:hypothetical protein
MSFVLNGGHVLYPDRPTSPDPFQLGVSHGVHHLFADFAPAPAKLKARLEELGVTVASIEHVVETEVTMAEEGFMTASLVEIDTMTATIEEVVDGSPIYATVEDC